MKREFISFMLTVAVSTGILSFPVGAGAEDKLLAFPGAEGGGKYTEGARGADNVEVYHVTNLNDGGEGSLRDAISKEGRIVVFDVGGVIHLESQLRFKKDNITILGQTAPGDGITITGNDLLIDDGKSNIIIRYIRVRPSDDSGGEPDGIGGRWVSNVILDHCSISWSVDEALTLYAGSLEDREDVSENITVQNCITSESMRMSNHIKGAHGYGGIIGGTNASYIDNLFAHHDSRSPRFDRNLKSTDFTNNIIYNWGNTNNLYGAEPYSYSGEDSDYIAPEYASNVNIVNNYFKYGPSTRTSLRSRIFDVSNDSDTLKSNFYVNGNYVYGNEDATADNENFINNGDKANFLDQPVDMGEYAIESVSAEQTLTEVLDDVGATLPRRDSIDARVVADVINGTGRIINNDEEVGGLSSIEEAEREFTIPADWKEKSGMGDSAPEDIAPSGYTWIEEYVNDWTEAQSSPSNPSITVESPAVANYGMSQDKTDKMGSWEVISEDDGLVYKMTAASSDGTEIVKTELWDGETLLKEYDSAVIDETVMLEPGTHYIFSRAYNEKGEKTDSPTSIVYVTGTQAAAGTVAEIGASANDGGALSYPGKSAAWTQDENTYISGSGLIGGKADSCAYMYYPVNGDFEYTVRISDIPKYENGVMAGIMFRETLDPGSRMVMVSDSWFRYGENVIMPVRTETNADADFVWMCDSEGNDIANNSGYNTNDYPVPRYMKIAREGDIITVSVSNNGITWDGNARQPYEISLNGLSENGYIGIACDSVNGSGISESSGSGNKTGSIPLLPWYTIAGFSDERGVNVGTLPTPEPTPEIPPYEDPNSLPTTVPIENSTFINMSEYEDDYAESIKLILDGFIRVYARSGNEVALEDCGEVVLEDGTVFNKRLRISGAGKFNEDNTVPTSRAIELMPAKDGKLTVYFAGTGGNSRALAMMQCGSDIAEAASENGELTVLTQNVSGGNRVYLYPKTAAIGILGIKYEPADEQEKPDTDYGISAQPLIDEEARTAEFTVVSYVNRRQTAEAIVVIKDEEGRLLSVEPEKIEFDGSGSVNVTVDCSAALDYAGEAEISLLLWESLESMRPLDTGIIE